jgi:hypothetical protein
MGGARICIPRQQANYHMKKYRSLEDMKGMQEQLFDIPPPPRPDYYGVEVKRVIIPDIATAIMNCNRARLTELDGYVEDVTNMLDEIITENFYDYSNYLEDVCGWEVNEPIMSVLAQIPYMRHDAHDDLVQRWVLLNGIKPKYSVSQYVSFNDTKHGLLVGEITSVDLARGQYYLATDIEEPDGRVDAHPSIKKYEDVIEQVIPHVL